jgi:hypothetical protein
MGQNPCHAALDWATGAPTRCLCSLKAFALSLWKVFMNPELDPWLQLDLAPREDEDDDGDSYEGEDDDLDDDESDSDDEG